MRNRKANRHRYYLKNKEKIQAVNKAYGERVAGSWHMYQRNRMLIQRYGITHAQYEEMFARQGGKCALCKTGIAGVKKRYLDIDHCHKTGKVRGLLCGSCNKSLGVLENESWIEMARTYLEHDPL